MNDIEKGYKYCLKQLKKQQDEIDRCNDKMWKISSGKTLNKQ